MPTTLLRPALLSAKNSFIESRSKPGNLFRTLAIVLAILGLAGGIYWFAFTALETFRKQQTLFPGLTSKIIGLTLFLFFVLVQCSSFMAAVGRLYTSKDLPFFLTLPVSKLRLYSTQLISITFQSSWMFAIMIFPCLLALKVCWGLDGFFIALSIFLLIPFLLIPAALSTILATLFVNLIPAARVKDILTVVLSILLAAFYFLGRAISSSIDSLNSKKHDEKALDVLEHLRDPTPHWLPHRWYSDVITSYIDGASSSIALSSCKLLLLATALYWIGCLLYQKLFMRGFAMANSLGEKAGSRSHRFSSLTRLAFPWQPQFRSLLYKELRLVLRDTTQSLQLLILLLLTLLYLYNFRSLRMISHIDPATADWWRAILGASSIALGGCVTSAIATRFAYPSISMEGRSWTLLRCSPLSIIGLLHRKFFIWLIPMSVLNLTLLISGALAIQLQPMSIAICAAAGLSLTIGIVGLALGVGGVFAKFDWENLTQISSGLGSLIYMSLCFALLFLNEILAAPLIILTEVDSLREIIGANNYRIVILSLVFLLFFINVSIARKALKAGEQSLLERES